MQPKRKYGVFAENTSSRTAYLCGEPVFMGGVQLMLETYDIEEAERYAEELERNLSVIWRVRVY